MLRGALRYLKYLALFLVGLIAVPLLVDAVVDISYREPVGILSVLGYIFGFCYWTRKSEAGIVDASTRKRNDQLAVFMLSSVSIAAGIAITVIFYPLLPQSWVHPFVAMVIVPLFLTGPGLIVGGILGLYKALQENIRQTS